jgi:hypothetical protein
MRPISFALVAALAASFFFAAPAAAARGTVYGKGVKAPKVLRVSELLANPEAYVGKVVRVKGTVTDVCPMRGCWIRIAAEPAKGAAPAGGGTVTFKVTDGVMEFPTSAKGHQADAEGVLTKLELSEEAAVARARHEAEEKGVPYDPKVFPTVRVVYLLKGTGAVID